MPRLQVLSSSLSLSSTAAAALISFSTRGGSHRSTFTTSTRRPVSVSCSPSSSFQPPSRVFWQSRVSTRCVLLRLSLEHTRSTEAYYIVPGGVSSSCVIIIDNVTTTTQELITATELGRSAKAKLLHHHHHHQARPGQGVSPPLRLFFIITSDQRPTRNPPVAQVQVLSVPRSSCSRRQLLASASWADTSR